MMPPVFLGFEKADSAWKRYFDFAFNDRALDAASALDDLESCVREQCITLALDPEDILPKIKRIRAVLRQPISTQGKRRKLTRYTLELVEAMRGGLKGNPKMILKSLMRKFGRELVSFMQHRDGLHANVLQGILNAVEDLEPMFKAEDERVKGIHRQFTKLIIFSGKVHASTADVTARKEKATTWLASAAQDFISQGNLILAYSPEIGEWLDQHERELFEHRPQKRGEGEGQGGARSFSSPEEARGFLKERGIKIREEGE